MEDTPLSMYSYWWRPDRDFFATKLLSVKLRGRSGGRSNMATPWISTKKTEFWEGANCKFTNYSHGRTWLKPWRTTNEEISDIGLVMAAPIQSVRRDYRSEIFLFEILEQWCGPLIYFFRSPGLSAWRIPTWTWIQPDSHKGTSFSFSPQQKHRLADDNKKRVWVTIQLFHYWQNKLPYYRVKEFALFFLAGKRKLLKYFVFSHIYEETLCAGIALCVCVRRCAVGSLGSHDSGRGSWEGGMQCILLCSIFVILSETFFLVLFV